MGKFTGGGRGARPPATVWQPSGLAGGKNQGRDWVIPQCGTVTCPRHLQKWRQADCFATQQVFCQCSGHIAQIQAIVRGNCGGVKRRMKPSVGSGASWHRPRSTAWRSRPRLRVHAPSRCVFLGFNAGGGETPPQPAGEDACATGGSVGCARQPTFPILAFPPPRPSVSSGSNSRLFSRLSGLSWLKNTSAKNFSGFLI